MGYKQIIPVFDPQMRLLCIQPYPNHPKGCPNYAKKRNCPPNCGLISELIDIGKSVYVIWNVFDFLGHTQRMRTKHPNWSKRQIECCLYWQPKARKQLKVEIAKFLDDFKGYKIITTPEGAGINVTATMEMAGIKLEWPPKIVAYQVAMGGSLPSK